MITIEQVSKTYGKKEALSPLSLTISAGECVALCGGNGAGKSTLLKALTTIHTPTTGTIHLNGYAVEEAAYKRQFTYMPDDLIFPAELTAEENITMMANMQGAPVSRVEEVLDIVGLQEVKAQKVKTFSKGMHQRLAFAQSLLSDAPILILDEPTNGLDPYWVAEMQKVIMEEHAKGRTILFTTHLLPIVEKMADRLVFLREGQLFIDEPVAPLLERYSSLDDYLFEQYKKERS